MSFIGSHPLASAFIRKFTNGTGGIPPLQYEIEALNYWCWENEKNGLLSKYIAYYPMICGANPGTSQSIINMSYNLISPDPYTATPLYNLTANNITGSMCTANGYKGNGTSSYWATTLNLGVISLNSIRGSMYCNIPTMTTIYMADWGMYNGNANNSIFIRNNSLTTVNACAYDNTFILPTISLGGLASIIRQSSSVAGYYQNGLLISSMGSLVGWDSNANNFYLGAENYVPGGYANGFTNRSYGSFAFGSALNATQESTAWQIEQTFQKTLGRAISF